MRFARRGPRRAQARKARLTSRRWNIAAYRSKGRRRPTTGSSSRLMSRQRANLLCEGWDRRRGPVHFAHDLRALADSFRHSARHAARLSRPEVARREEEPERQHRVGHDNYGSHEAGLRLPRRRLRGGVPPRLFRQATQLPMALHHAARTDSQRDGHGFRPWRQPPVDVHWCTNPYVAAYQLSLFLDMAWDVKAADRADVGSHLKGWLAEKLR